MKQPLTISLLGRSGSGKGEQAKRLRRKLKNELYIYTGERLRALAKEPTLAGKMVKSILKEGNLTPGWLASYTWMHTLIRELDRATPLLFDGTPRQKSEAELLDKVLEWFGRNDAKVIYIDVSEKEATRRLLGRGRGDDHARAIRHRLQFFTKNVAPALEYYKKKKQLIRINGEQSIDGVFRDICKALHL
jgi:adenylate kinase